MTIERRERGQPERLQVRLGEPFTVPIDKTYLNRYGSLSVDFKTEDGKAGGIEFRKYTHHSVTNLVAPFGAVEIREITHVDDNGSIRKEFSYPVSPALYLDLDWKIDEVLAGYAASIGKEASRQGHQLIDALDERVQWVMLANGKSYRGLIGSAEWGEDKQYVEKITWNTWTSNDKWSWVKPLFASDPEIISKIQFVINIPSLEAKQE